LLVIANFKVFIVFYFCQFLGADISAHRAFLSGSVQCHLLSIFCTFVIEQINDDDDDDNDDEKLTFSCKSLGLPHDLVCFHGDCFGYLQAYCGMLCNSFCLHLNSFFVV